MPAGVLFSLVAYFLYSCCDAIIKGFGSDLAVFEIAFWTALFSFLPVIFTKPKEEKWTDFWHMRHPWLGWDEAGALRFHTPSGELTVPLPRATVLALGGGSWAKLGSDGLWAEPLRAQGVDVAPLRPANCGFDAAVRSRPGWSTHLAERFAGQPFKSVGLSVVDGAGRQFSRKGEAQPAGRSVLQQVQRWVAAMWWRRYPAGLTPPAQPQPEPMHADGYQYWKRWVPSKYVPYCSTTGVGQYGRKGEESGERWRGRQYPAVPPNL